MQSTTFLVPFRKALRFRTIAIESEHRVFPTSNGISRETRAGNLLLEVDVGQELSIYVNCSVGRTNLL